MIKRIREFFGLTQDDLSVPLKTTRSHVNMIERNERSLSNNQLELLLPFSQLIDELNAGKLEEEINDDKDFSEIIEKQKFKSEQFLKYRINECRYKLARTERALEFLKEDKARCMNIWKILPILKKRALPEQRYMILVIKKYAIETQDKIGEDLQLKMEARLVGLTAELEFLEKQLPE